MNNFLSFFITILFSIFILSFICIITIYFHETQLVSNTIANTEFFFSNSDFFWPIPGYHTISSFFGKRNSPTTGASSNHTGIDISAPEGTSIFSILPGTIIFTGFYGPNGHTIIMQSEPYTLQYSHVSPNYIVKIGDIIEKGNFIACVGPKYIDDVLNNPYKDPSGKSTNGATTGTHLHLTIKKDGILINPLDFFE